MGNTVSNSTLEFVDVGIIDLENYNPENEQNSVFALFILIFCSFSIFLQFLIMSVLITDSELKKLPAFQIMFFISVFDTIQLFMHMTAVYYILDARPHFQFADFAIGAIMNASWVTMLLLSIFLNINRLMSITLHSYSKFLFSPITMKINFSAFLLVFLLIFALNVTGASGMVYLLPTYTWHYLQSRSVARVVRQLSADISLVDVVFSFLSHFSIFSYIYFKAAIVSRKEFILTVQVLGVSVFHVAGYLTWEYVPIPWDHPIGLFSGHFIWMLWNSINPLLYILINPRIRNLVLSTFRAKNQAISIRNSSNTWAAPIFERTQRGVG